MTDTAVLADRLAILELINRYTQAVNHRDWVALQAVWESDAVWDAGGPDMGPQAYLFRGAEACTQGIAALLAKTRICIQSNHAVTLDIDGDRASATSTINELVIGLDASTATTIWGTYYDDIARQADGSWRFARRRFRFSYIDAGMPGVAPLMLAVQRP